MQQELHNCKIHCPYCGEPLELLVDPSAGSEDYIEDCQVCCRPMELSLEVDADGSCTLSVRHENE